MNTGVLTLDLGREFTEEELALLKKTWREQKFKCDPLVVDDEPPAKRIEACVSTLRPDAKGTLFMKMRGDWTQNDIQHLQDGLGIRLKEKHPDLNIIVLMTSDYRDIDLQLQTNDQLQTLGFKRV